MPKQDVIYTIVTVKSPFQVPIECLIEWQEKKPCK